MRSRRLTQRSQISRRCEVTCRSPLIVFLLALFGAMAPLRAQTVRGQVTDSVAGTVVARGFVVLVNDRGQDVARTLADERGRFVISARDPGEYRVRSERIGYRVWESELIELRANQVVQLTLRVTAIPSRLADIEVLGESECRAAWDDVDTATLWEEARKALAAASWAEHEELYEYRLHNFAITQLSGRSPQVDVSASEATAMLPFQAETLERLIEEGYVIDEGGAWAFYGPDANVLLDQRFHETHCFGTRRGKGEFDGMLGLTFRPISSRRLPEIEGVLWVDAESSRLRRIEYSYEHLPFSVSRRGAGGSIFFETMESGAWIINDWTIRMPLPTGRRILTARGSRTPDALRSGTVRQGAKIIEAFNLEGEREYVHPDAVHMRGTVFDSIRGGPLANDAVLVPGTGYEVITDSTGAFAFNTLLEGQYDVTSGRLDSLGLPPGPFRFVPRDTLTVELVVPSLDTLYSKLCPDIELPDDRFIVVGQVRDFEDEEPISGASVAAVWRPTDEDRAKADSSARDELRTETDPSGRFALCALPAGQQIYIVVLGEDAAAEPVGVLFEDGLVMHETRIGRRQYAAPERIWRVDLWVEDVLRNN